MLQLTMGRQDILPVCAAFYAAAFSAPPWYERYEDDALIAYFSAFCHQEARRCFVLTDEAKPVGIALCTMIPCPDAPFMRVEDLCIDPTRQRKGYGSAMISLLREEARSLGCDCIMLSTQRGYPAHDFYLKNGFTEVDSVQLVSIL